MAFTDVKVTGYRELLRHLKDLAPETRKELVVEFKVVANRAAAKARARIPRRSGRARGSVRTGVTTRAVYVQEGSAAVPYVGWLDYGGTLHPSGGRLNTIARPVVSEGRYLYPVVRAERAATVAGASKAVERAIRKAHL